MIQGPSVFPILFACVLGRASQAILQWRLEKGEYTGILDMLAGSTSLTSTVISQLKLRLFSSFGLALVFVWTLSPIGGQACVRLMDIGTKITMQNDSFVYMIHSPDFYKFGGSDTWSYRAITDTLFGSAVIAPPTVKSSPFDVWGHVKIPALEHHERVSEPDSEGWFDTRSDQTEYTSLSGIPMSGINETRFIDYKTRIETQYFSLRCAWHVGSPTPQTNHSAIKYEGRGAYIWTYDDPEKRNLTDVDMLKPLEFYYRAVERVKHWSECLLTTAYVEAEIHCAVVSSCAVSRVRRSTKDNPPPASSLLDRLTNQRRDVLSVYAGQLLGALSGDKNEGTNSVLQSYLFAPNDILGRAGEGRIDLDPELSNETYSLRLQRLMNAYWACLTTPYALNSGMTPETADMEGVFDESHYLAHSAVSTGSKNSKDEVILAHKTWCVILCLSSMSIVVASLCRCVVYHLFCKGPDITLNVSCLVTRDNPFVKTPERGTFLDASDRAKLVKGLRIRFGDVSTLR